jgi:hypothetical protein
MIILFYSNSGRMTEVFQVFVRSALEYYKMISRPRHPSAAEPKRSQRVYPYVLRNETGLPIEYWLGDRSRRSSILSPVMPRHCVSVYFKLSAVGIFLLILWLCCVHIHLSFTLYIEYSRLQGAREAATGHGPAGGSQRVPRGGDGRADH